MKQLPVTKGAFIGLVSLIVCLYMFLPASELELSVPELDSTIVKTTTQNSVVAKGNYLWSPVTKSGVEPLE